MNQNFRSLRMALLAGLLVVLGTGCSSSPVDEGDGSVPSEDALQADGAVAEADAVPEDGTVPPADADSYIPAPEDPVADQAPMPPADASNESYAGDTSPAPLSDSSGAAMTESGSTTAPLQDSGETRIYKVKKGDTLMKIAFEQYGDLYRWREIYEANNDKIRDPSNVPPGTRLVLSAAGSVAIEHNGERYLIKRGDTLGTISNDVYGTPRRWKDLWNNNRQMIKSPNRIYAGFYLYYVPDSNRLSNQSAPTDDRVPANEPAADVAGDASPEAPADFTSQ